MVPATLAVGAAVAGTAWWLLSILPALTGAEQATAQIEVVRTALAAGAGIGGAVTLMLAFRRQRHQEIATALIAHDADERRVTELYAKAAEQLGSDKAPVRLAGLYALERLAQGSPDHRQTIVNLICAYLRMPCAQPRTERGDRIRAAQRAHHTARPPAPAAKGHDPDEEREVRLTAQQILIDHLRVDGEIPPNRLAAVPGARFWPDIDLNLSGALLLDLDLARCRIAGARFDGATFSGNTRFGYARFSGDARFDRAVFSGHAWFGYTNFFGGAWFSGTTFSGDAWFGHAVFSAGTGFNQAAFSGHTEFSQATFFDDVRFDQATFSRHARFDKVTFSGDARFDRAAFRGEAKFDRAVFSRHARFGQATFSGHASFD
jgi:uncharacterized protein YjbI with pentapeptide repeats